MATTADDISEDICQRVIRDVDGASLRAGISRRDTARIYRDIASACRDRAAGLEAEADADGE